MADDLHAGNGRADAESAVFRHDLADLRDLFDVDQERGLDQVGFHLHDDVGAASQDARRSARPCQQRYSRLQRFRRFISEIRHYPPQTSLCRTGLPIHPTISATVGGVDYLSRSLILAMPASAQASSFSPPGAPLTAMAPIVSFSTLIGTPPRSIVNCASNWRGLNAPG